MRAGLLSQPQVIQRLNKQFVCTTLTYPEVWKLAQKGNRLAREVDRQWTIPLVVVLFTPDCQFVSKLSSLTELNEVHPDTTRRTEAPQRRSLESEANNTRVFMQHLDFYFPLQSKP